MVQLLSNAKEEDRQKCEEFAREDNDKLIAIWRVSEENRETIEKNNTCQVWTSIIALLLCLAIAVVPVTLWGIMRPDLDEEKKLQEEELQSALAATGAANKATLASSAPLSKPESTGGFLCNDAMIVGILVITVPGMLLIASFMCRSYWRSEKTNARLEGMVWALGEKNFYKLRSIDMGKLYKSGDDRAYCDLGQITSVTVDHKESGLFYCYGGTTGVKLHVPVGNALVDTIQHHSGLMPYAQIGGVTNILHSHCTVLCNDPESAVKMIREQREKYLRSSTGAAKMVVLQMQQQQQQLSAANYAAALSSGADTTNTTNQSGTMYGATDNNDANTVSAEQSTGMNASVAAPTGTTEGNQSRTAAGVAAGGTSSSVISDVDRATAAVITGAAQLRPRSEDVFAKIMQLKQLLDAEAITQFEYDEKRREMMARI
ncbi:unnamed protein product [Amoebophrya sp. A120]|nr:unnamed protein product [Amoebophrya sp. A120]|eukprot:GSA120T00015811001.1